mmetsp:Transcript_37690/g.89141  ORF Transcript_37690/g.89141 Transcript_37690/m.89141 type:complete len:491 (+) Transcript_37690:42-1514(+)
MCVQNELGTGDKKGVVRAKLPSSMSWAQVAESCSAGRKLMVISGAVYDVEEWVQKHPGGKVLLTYVGEEASDPVAAFHRDKQQLQKYLAPLRVAELDEQRDTDSAAALQAKNTRNTELEKDFRDLRSKLEEAGMFQPKMWFYALMLFHVIALELAGWAVLFYFGRGWVPYTAAVLLLVVAQAQAGWLQHDFGHLSVFKSRAMNLLAHRFIILHLKAASSAWWNYRHYLHHAKPNIAEADPDINMPYVFMLGEDMGRAWAEKQKQGKAGGVMPYNKQQHYWWLVGPPLLLPLYFHYENLRYVLGNAILGKSGMWKDSYNTQRYLKGFRQFFWEEVAWMLSFFVRWHFMYGPLLGGVGGWFTFYMVVRTVESHWFVWVTQMSHLSMSINKYAKTTQRDWPSLQANASCNVEGGWFNDWFTGHLNYQIEHHIFPTMPRHNYSKVAPMVQSLFKRHNMEQQYVCKSLLGAFGDIVSSLERYGSAWADAYYDPTG